MRFQAIVLRKIVIKICSLSIVLIATQVAFAQLAEVNDPQRYTFPDTWDGRSQLHTPELARVLQVAQQLNDLGQAQKPDRGIPQGELTNARGTLAKVLAESNDKLARSYASRRTILLDWYDGTTDGNATAKRLLNMAATDADAESKQFTTGFAATVLARSGRVEEGAKVFSELDPQKTPQFGWFAFEIVKYYGDYVHASVSADERMKGLPDDEEHRRSSEFATFLKDTCIPSLAKYQDVAAQRAGIEKAQFLSVFDKTAGILNKVLARRLYLDISEQTTDVLFPKLLAEWKRACALAADPQCGEEPEWHLNRIMMYEEQVIPQIKQLQDRRQSMIEFGHVVTKAERELNNHLSSLDAVESVPSPNLSEAASAQMTASNGTVLAAQKSETLHVNAVAHDGRTSTYIILCGVGFVLLVLAIVVVTRRRSALRDNVST